MRSFEEIQAWQKARELVREIYKISHDGKIARDFGFRDQICRAAVSSMSNIAEGFSRKGDREFAHFLDIAKGSVGEVQSLLYVALDVGYVNRDEFSRLQELAGQTAQLVSGFLSYLRKSESRNSEDEPLRKFLTKV